MKQIPLTQGRFALVDDADFERVNQFKWLVRKETKSSTLFYAKRCVQRAGGGRKFDYMHRFIMSTPDGMATDHINGDTLDNRRDNLRVCTRCQNLQNSKLKSTNTSGYKGVSPYFKLPLTPWLALIRANGGRKYLGYFPTAAEAAAAYDIAAIRLHGEFARTNKMMGLLP